MSRNMDRTLVVGGLSEVGMAVVERLWNHHNPFIVVGDKNNKGFQEMAERLRGDMVFEEVTMGNYDSIATFKEKFREQEGFSGFNQIVVVSEPFSLRNRTKLGESMEQAMRPHFLDPMITIAELSEISCYNNTSIIYVAPTPPPGNSNSVIYTAANAGIEGFIQAKSKDLAKDEIRVNMIIPGKNSTIDDIAGGVKALAYHLKCTGETIKLGYGAMPASKKSLSFIT